MPQNQNSNPSWQEMRVLPCPIQEEKGIHEGEERWKEAPAKR